MTNLIFLSFIGIAINIWSDILGGGGVGPDDQLLRDRFGAAIEDRFGDNIYTRQ